MAKKEWFRRQTWTPADQADFRARLQSSRSTDHKAQYLRLQAFHLQEVGTSTMFAAALELLDELVQDHPDRMQLSEAHNQRAECLLALNKPEEGLEAYRAALAAERAFPKARGDAYLGFAELVLALGRGELYSMALAVQEEFGQRESFPIHQYRSAASRAFLYEALAHPQLAAANARNALTAAAMTESPFRYHRRLGLVDQPDAAIQARLWRLAQLTT